MTETGFGDTASTMDQKASALGEGGTATNGRDDGPIHPAPLVAPQPGLLSPRQMADLESSAVADGTSLRTLMATAGRAAAAVAEEHIGPVSQLSGPVAVVCGPGGNGGDGYVLAQALMRDGYPVKVLRHGSPQNEDASYYAERFDGEIADFSAAALDGVSCVVDALFGAGLNRDVDEAAAAVIDAMNASPALKIAIDLPSGVDGANGEIRGVAVQADATITFQRRKPGHLVAPGRFLCGGLQTVAVVDIGIKADLLAALKRDTFENDPALWGHLYPQAGPAHHKYDRGHVLVLGGREPALGASRMAAMAAMRVGAGLVTLAAHADTYTVQAAALTDVMVRRFESNFGFAGILSGKNIGPALIGPGSGVGANTSELIAACVESDSDLVLDADALTSIAGRVSAVFSNYQGEAVLTPHDGEFARLFPDIPLAEDRLLAARQAAKLANTVIVLKGVSTLIAHPDGRVYINTNAPAWLSVGGTGDVLAGMIAGFMGQGMPAFEAAAAAVWTHGLTAQRCGRGMLASDMLYAIKRCLL